MELSGHTRFLSLFDLAQVLSVNEATGMLKVERDEGRAYLYFQDGTIINAMDDEHREGEDAAKRVFSMKDAEYSFASDLPSVARRIQCSTQNLMMEIARQLDEESATDEELAGGDYQREALQATSLLSELFTRFDSESKVLAHRSPEGFGVAELLDAIKDSPDSTLFLRAEASPEVQVAGRVIPLSDKRLEPRAFENLRDHLVRSAVGGIDRADGRPEEYVLHVGPEQIYRLEVLHGGLTQIVTLRRLPPAEQLAAAMPWAPETLASVLDEPGALVLLVANDTRTLENGFEAACAHLLLAGPGPFMGMARRWTPGLSRGRASAMLLSSNRADDLERASELIDRVSPAVFAVEDCDRPESFQLALRAMRRGARAIVGVCARSSAFAPHRILDELAPTERPRFVRYLGTCLSGILTVRPGGTGRAWAVEEATRIALIGGDTEPLVTEIVSMESERDA
ncbi:MAG: DUF4388 domain-containing protein [Gemmatimonadetes bacterium]|nr:DUF4388 domain-containing protein [Gemmatimonadota bacterium]